MKKWMKDGLIGWAASAIFVYYVSPESGYVISVFSLVVGFFIGSLGGILLGRNHDGFIWPALGGFIAAIGIVAVYILLLRSAF